MNNIYITESDYQLLLYRLNVQELIIGALIWIICGYVLYRTYKIDKIELNAEFPCYPPIRTLVSGILLILLEVASIIVNHGAINFGTVNTISDVFRLIAYLLGYFIPLITGTVLVVSFIKRVNHYRNSKK